MIRTSVLFRPDDRAAKPVCIGFFYVSMTSDRALVYQSFMPSRKGGLQAAFASTKSDSMRTLLDETGLAKALTSALKASIEDGRLNDEPSIVEAIFHLLPPSLRHGPIEPYPSEDFFVRAIREAEQAELRKENVAVLNEAYATA